jgi:exodeoxyribonuclease VII large subunit
MKQRIEARFPTEIILYPTLVQGNEASRQVIAGVQYFNSLATNKPDLIIIARGGGSFEDLMPFNDEGLIRAVFASKIPVISAIGHEPDFTLLDYVADKRAPTPTAAAEIATPQKASLQQKITIAKEAINRVLINYLANKNKDLQNLHSQQASIVANFFSLQQQKLLKNTLPNLSHIFSKLQDKIKHCRQIITANLEKILQHKQARLDKCQIDNNLTALKIDKLQKKLSEMHSKIITQTTFHLEKKSNWLQNNQAILNSYHYQNVLKRGFAIVYNQQKQPITSIAVAKEQQSLILQMQDGDLLIKNEK